MNWSGDYFWILKSEESNMYSRILFRMDFLVAFLLLLQRGNRGPLRVFIMSGDRKFNQVEALPPYIWEYCSFVFVSICGWLNLDSKENQPLNTHTHANRGSGWNCRRDNCLKTLLSLILLSLHEVARIFSVPIDCGREIKWLAQGHTIQISWLWP